MKHSINKVLQKKILIIIFENLYKNKLYSNIMNTTKEDYIKIDENKILNVKFIRWMKKMDECIHICSITTGCNQFNLQPVCKLNNNDSYNKLNKYFE